MDNATLAREAWLDSWRDQAFIFQLARADADLHRRLVSSPPPGLRMDVREGWQQLVTIACRSSTRILAYRHLRRLLDRWNVHVLPGRRVARAIRHLRLLGCHCSPRVQAAYLRTIFNGWCTRRRFQGGGCCRLGCGSSEDSIEHMAHCPRASHWFRLFLTNWMISHA